MISTYFRNPLKGLAAAAVLAAAATAAQANSSVYQQAVRSTAWVISPISKEKGDSLGSGALVDAGRRLVVTNYHVVENRKDAMVFFPSFQDGEPVSLRSFYVNNAAKLAIKGKVLVAEPRRDLAVIQLERLPEGVQPFPLAKRSVSAGATIHVIGNSDVNNGTLWRYSNGFVRGVFPKTIKTGNKIVKEFTLSARIVESQLPGNPGDSGGPVVNDQGELVAIHQGNNPNQQLVSFGVDINEVRAIIAASDKGGQVAAGTEEVAAVEEPIQPKRAPKIDEVAAVEEPIQPKPAPKNEEVAAVEEPIQPKPAPKIEDVTPKPSPVTPPPARKAPVPTFQEPVVPAPKHFVPKPPVKIVPKCVQPQWGCARRGCH